MDTVTQALLGGAVGYAIAGKTSPRKAILWGAAIAVLPDLDIFIPYEDDLASITNHRSWSHSWIVQTLLAPLIALLLSRYDRVFNYKTWALLTWLVLITHSGLDALTVFGTQLFWPFMPPPISGGSVFIIDPIYSALLLLGFVAILIKPNSSTSHKALSIGFILSCLYLVWGLTIQTWITLQVKPALVEQHIKTDKVLVQASPLNTLLWRVLVIDNTNYYQGYYSIFDDDYDFNFKKYPRKQNLITANFDNAALARLNWFTNGFYALDTYQDYIIAKDLRMGSEPVYFFRYYLAKNTDQSLRVVAPNRLPRQPVATENLKRVWQRIWNANSDDI